MLYWKIVQCSLFLGWLLVMPNVHAKPDENTVTWEQNVFQALQENLCGPKGKYLNCFQITQKQCKTFYKKAQKNCQKALRSFSYYQVWNEKTGRLWGKFVGLCVGITYNMKFQHKKKIP